MVAWGGQDNWDVEIRAKTDQWIELFILVKGVAGVKDAMAEGEAGDGDWLTGQSGINLFEKFQLPIWLELEKILL